MQGGERERDSASRVHCCGLCHPLNIEQNSAKRHSNSYVKIDAVLCFAFRLAAACFDIWASAGRQSHDLDIKLSNSLKKFSVFQWMSANEAEQLYLMSRKQSDIILVWINLIIGVFFLSCWPFKTARDHFSVLKANVLSFSESFGAVNCRGYLHCSCNCSWLTENVSQ